MFESIKELYFEGNGLLFMNKLPINVLFDPIESNLESINTFHCNSDYDAWKENIIDFVEKYINFKQKLENEGKSIRILKYIRQRSFRTRESFLNQLLSIESKHIMFRNQTIDLNQLMLYQTAKQTQSLRIMTIGKFVALRGKIAMRKNNICIPSNNENNGNHHDQLHIETLRFINVSNVRRKIFNNQEMIESLNFHNSVKNMTLNIIICDMNACHKWTRVLLNLLTKKYYFNLENLNILFCFHVSIGKIFLNVMDWIFDMLKENCENIKYQFKQLNIAFKSILWNLINIERYDVIEWNDKIDKHLLNEYQIRCKKFCQTSQPRKQQGENVKKYEELKNQWLD